MPELACTACGHAFDREEEARCPRCLKKSTVVEWTSPEQGAGERHRRANAWLMTAMVVLHVLTALSVVINLIGDLSGYSAELLGPAMTPRTTEEKVGHWSAFACIGGFAIAGLVWAPVNAWGLFRGRPWARISSITYWSASLLTCCCVPMGAYGLWSLLREDVADSFGS